MAAFKGKGKDGRYYIGVLSIRQARKVKRVLEEHPDFYAVDVEPADPKQPQREQRVHVRFHEDGPACTDAFLASMGMWLIAKAS